MNLIELETLIHNLARMYSADYAQLKSLEIAGRIAAWRSIDDLSTSSADELKLTIEPVIMSYSENHGIKLRDGSIKDIVSIPRSELALLLKRRLENRYGKTNARSLMEKEDHPSDVVRALVRTALVEVAHSHPIHMLDYAYMDFFRECGLEDIIWTFYLGDPVKAVLDSFPSLNFPWEFGNVPKGYWLGKNGWEHTLFALNWFAEKKGIRTVEDCKFIGQRHFSELRLDGMLEVVFNCSPYLALSTLFPDLKPWQGLGSPRRYYLNRENRKEALLWLLIQLGIGQIAEMTPEEVYDTKIRSYSFTREIPAAGMRGNMKFYDDNIYYLFMDFYPDQILPWTLKGIKTPWRINYMETAAKAIRWLFEKYLQIPGDEIPEYATCPLFLNVGFSGILTQKKFGFGSSPFAAVDNAYPGLFSPSDFKRGRITQKIR